MGRGHDQPTHGLCVVTMWVTYAGGEEWRQAIGSKLDISSMCSRWWLIQKSNTGQCEESTHQGSAHPHMRIRTTPLTQRSRSVSWKRVKRLEEPEAWEDWNTAVLWTWRDHCAHEPTAAVLPSQDTPKRASRSTSGMDWEGAHGPALLTEGLWAADCFFRGRFSLL